MHRFTSESCDFNQTDDVNWNQDIVFIIKSTIKKFLWLTEELKPSYPNIVSDLSEKYSHILSKFIANNSEYLNFEKNFPLNFDQWEINSEFHLLAKQIGQVIFIYLCKNAKPEELSKQQVKLPALDTIKAVYYPPYYLGEALKDIIPKNQTYALLREYFRIEVAQRKNKQLNINLLEDLAKFYDKASAKTHNFQSFVGEKKYFMSTTGCLWATALQNAEDHDIMYSLLCHSDYITPIQFNPNFRLTRTKTLIQGDSYCDFCYHDIRYDSDLSHPSADDWKKLFN